MYAPTGFFHTNHFLSFINDQAVIFDLTSGQPDVGLTEYIHELAGGNNVNLIPGGIITFPDELSGEMQEISSSLIFEQYIHNQADVELHEQVYK